MQILFDLCLDPVMTQLHSQALRAVATVCCVTESIEELEKVGGVEALSDMLSSQSASESVRAEAAGVVAQILSPCLDQYTHLAGFLENMDDLVRSLTSQWQSCMSSAATHIFLKAGYEAGQKFQKTG